MAKRDYYEILGVGKEAIADEVKKAYRKLAMQHHPDRNGGDADAEVKFKEATEAYQVLSDNEKRQRFDRYGHAGLDGAGGGSPFGNGAGMGDALNDFLANVFGEDVFGGRGGARGGRDLQITVEIDLTEAYRGTVKTITIPREEVCNDCTGSGAKRGTNPAMCRRCNGHGVVLTNQGFFRVQQTCRACGGRGAVITDPCTACQGRGRVVVKRTLEVPIPKGVDSGDRIPLRGEGEGGQGGRGDLYVQLRVREHALFHRDGPNLICQVPIAFSQAALGGDIEVPTIEGRTNTTLKRGVQSGDVVRVVGQGMPNVRGGRPGDLLVQLLVETPKHLTKRQEELFRELAELEQKHVSPQRKSFLDKVRDFFTTEGAIDEAEAKPQP